MRWIAVLCLTVLAGCVSTPAPQAPGTPQAAPAQASASPSRAKVDQFVAVVRTVEPVAEQFCAAQTGQGTNCDFRIVVDDRPGQPPNAFQTLDRDGRPIIAFTLAMIAEVRNQDELAFVMSPHFHGPLGCLRITVSGVKENVDRPPGGNRQNHR